MILFGGAGLLQLAIITLVMRAFALAVMPRVMKEEVLAVSSAVIFLRPLCSRWRTLHTYFRLALGVFHLSDDVPRKNMVLLVAGLQGCRYIVVCINSVVLVDRKGKERRRLICCTRHLLFLIFKGKPLFRLDFSVYQNLVLHLHVFLFTFMISACKSIAI